MPGTAGKEVGIENAAVVAGNIIVIAAAAVRSGDVVVDDDGEQFAAIRVLEPAAAGG